MEKLEEKWGFLREVGASENDNDSSDFTESCVESNIVEPPSEQFVAAISKENVYAKFLKRLHAKGEFKVEYNDWDDISISQSADDDSASNFGNEEIPENREITAANKNVQEKMLRLIRRVKAEFDLYCHRLIVIGFNCGKYDLNLVKTKLPKRLDLHIKSEKNFIIKKNNNYTCIATEKLKFLDMMNYLPPGT